MMQRVAGLLILLAIPGTYCLADVLPPTTAAAPPPLDSGWKGRTDLGYFDQSGNSAQKSSLNFKTDIQRQWQDFILENHAEAVSASDDTAGSTERYLVFSKQRWNRSDVDYKFIQEQFEKDSTSQFQRQYNLSAGLGRTLYQAEGETLTAEAGLGVRQSDQKTGGSETSPLYTGALQYRYKLNSRASFQQRIGAELGSDSNILRSLTELHMQIRAALGLAVSYDVKREYGDTAITRLNLTTISLTYSY